MIAAVARPVIKPPTARPPAEELSHRAHLSRCLSARSICGFNLSGRALHTRTSGEGATLQTCLGIFAVLVYLCFDLGEIEFEYRFNLRYCLETMMPRLAYVASRIAPMLYSLLKRAEVYA
jgi:hypothetical protein